MVGKRVAWVCPPRRIGLELAHEDRRAGDPLECRAPHEALGRRGLDHADRMPGLDRQPGQLHGLVGGDPAAHAKEDPSHGPLRARATRGSGT